MAGNRTFNQLLFIDSARLYADGKHFSIFKKILSFCLAGVQKRSMPPLVFFFTNDIDLINRNLLVDKTFQTQALQHITVYKNLIKKLA